MKTLYKSLLVASLALVSVSALAQEGKPWIHDPSTIMECEGKY